MCKKIYLDNDRLPIPPRIPEKKEVIILEQPKVELDILAVFTIYTKLVFSEIANLYQVLKSSTFYRVLTRTTQPAHLVVMLSAIFLGAAIYPTGQKMEEGPKSSGYQFMYVLTTAVHFGSQIWMTFISGLSLYFTLPRHDFGEVQKVLFPIYFTFTGILSAACIFSQARLFGFSSVTLLLVACFLVELIVRLRFCGPLVALIISKNEVEAQHGLGREVGKLAHDSELFSTPSYVAIHKKFRQLHMIIAIANMTCIGLSTLHIWLSLNDCQTC